MDFPTLFERYGWLVAIGLYFLPQAWSFLADRVWPERVRERSEAAKAIRDADATILKAKIEREDRESQQRLKLEERTVAAIERMESAITNGNQMLTTLHAAFVQHERFTYNTSLEIKQSIEELQDLDGLRKRTRDLEKEMQAITQKGIKK
jgi:hypothetical protein